MIAITTMTIMMLKAMMKNYEGDIDIDNDTIDDFCSRGARKPD